MAFVGCPLDVLRLLLALLPPTAASRATCVALRTRAEGWTWEQAVVLLLRCLNRRWNSEGWALAARCWAQRVGPPLPRLGHMVGTTQEEASKGMTRKSFRRMGGGRAQVSM